jgi:molecular chaperone GrpE
VAEAAAAAENAAESDPLDVIRQQSEENWSKYLRAVAELDNLRKRNARELDNARKFSAERLVSALLPVRDSLEAGLDTAAAGGSDLNAILEGERATLRLLVQAFADAGVAEIDPVGEPFDPERHEAMSLMASPTAEPNSVLTVIQKGYALHDRVIRPARVIVAAESPPANEGS